MLRLFGQRLVIVRITNLVPTELRIGWPSSFYGWVLDCFGSFILVVRTGEATEIVQRPAATTAMGYRCVECGFPITILYVQYSPGNIRLIKCENCKAVADGYIECEFMIILIDLILHKPKAYRHLLFNVLNQKTAVTEGLLRNATFGFILLECSNSDRSMLLNRHEDERKISSSGIRYQKVTMDFLVGNSLFLCVFLLATRIMLNSSLTFSRFWDFLLVILVSSYFKIFFVAMMVWEFPPSVIYIIDIFVLSSNMVALKVMSDSSTARCLGVCLCAHAIKLITSHVSHVRNN
ncbi:Protein ARV 1 [Linum perenne]